MLYRQNNPATLSLFTTVILSMLFGGCSVHGPGFPDIQDSAPRHNVDISKIPDAKPRYEEPSRYGNPESYVVYGQRYHLLDSSEGYVQRGVASWYGTKFHGRRTSSGEAYDMNAMTAAHKTLPIPTYAEVTNLDNGKRIVVKINDRGPFVKDRLIDLSYVAARKLGITARGTGRVEVRTISVAKNKSEPAIQPAIQAAEPNSADINNINTASNLYLQVGLFKDRSNAELLRSKLTTMALPAIHVSTDTSTAQTLYRVRIGPLSKDTEAEQLIEKLASQGHKGFRIRVD
jgi:rare lipoprotein A